VAIISPYLATSHMYAVEIFNHFCMFFWAVKLNIKCKYLVIFTIFFLIISIKPFKRLANHWPKKV
jgi:hypothetical protein